MSLELTLELPVQVSEEKIFSQVSVVEKCIWRRMAENPESTTFLPVRGRDDHPLSKCLYLCSGLNSSCQGYRSEGKYNN